LFVNPPFERYRASTNHLQASTQGSLLGVKGQLGIERRQERLDFARDIRGARRDITSAFAHVRVPLIPHELRRPGMGDLTLVLGTRLDRYDDIGSVTKSQVGLTWQLSRAVLVQAAISDSFRPPSLVELNLPRTAAQASLFDARRNEVTPIALVTGGNPNLRPTTGQSTSIGIKVEPYKGMRLSAEYWRVRVRHHISLLAPMVLLANEGSAIDGRIERAPRTAEDEASGRPGRLVQLDISRANVGGAATQGVDVAAEVDIKTDFGTFTPRLLLTQTDEFAYGDLPIAQIQLEDRVGVASEYGTIPKQRAVVSVVYERQGWQAALHARLTSSYRDRDAITREPIQRKVTGETIFDVSVTKRIGHWRVSVGALNVANREPPYAHAGGSVGLDLSQGDLEGRVIYGMLGGTF
jgi:iron complex outermembrane receptor protein